MTFCNVLFLSHISSVAWQYLQSKPHSLGVKLCINLTNLPSQTHFPVYLTLTIYTPANRSLFNTQIGPFHLSLVYLLLYPERLSFPSRKLILAIKYRRSSFPCCACVYILQQFEVTVPCCSFFSASRSAWLPLLLHLPSFGIRGMPYHTQLILDISSPSLTHPNTA